MVTWHVPIQKAQTKVDSVGLSEFVRSYFFCHETLEYFASVPNQIQISCLHAVSVLCYSTAFVKELFRAAI
jgi:hypothetical protein